ncbi:MAG: AGE family epimerase/isomerase [Cyclobacteriaceae bacterium]
MKDLIAELTAELENNIIPFWTGKMVDTENGGFYGRIDGNQIIHPHAGKGVILNSRILWAFSAMYRFDPSSLYQEMAFRAYDYLKNHFFDPVHGGVYWLVDYAGRPLDKKKQIYAQAFAIYGLSEYYLAFSKPKAMELAIYLFEKIEEYSFDSRNNGYFEAFSEDWCLLDDLRLSEKDANELKSMNTHLHVLEAYTNLYRIWPETQLKRQLINLVQVFLDKILNPDTYHFELFFDEKWQVKANTVSYGHDVEGSWLLQAAAEVIDDKSLLAAIKKIALKIVDVSLKEGFASDGSIYYEKSDNKLDTDRHWWPQAEALVALVNAWQIGKDKKYLKKARKTWSYIKKHQIDKKYGEWHYKVDKHDKPYTDEDKAGFWKCPYHNSRACLEVISRLQNSQPQAKKEAIIGS